MLNATAAACSHSKSWWLVVSIHYQLVMSCTLVIFKQGHESWWQSFSTTVVVLHKECKLQTHTYNHIQYICNISLGTPGSKEIKFDKLNGPPAYAFSKSKEQQLEYWRGIRWLDEAKRRHLHQNKGLRKGSFSRVKLHKLDPNWAGCGDQLPSLRLLAWFWGGVKKKWYWSWEWGRMLFPKHLLLISYVQIIKIHRFESCEWCAQTRWEVYRSHCFDRLYATVYTLFQTVRLETVRKASACHDHAGWNLAW